MGEATRLYREILAGNDLRQNLRLLRAQVKEEKSLREWMYLCGGDFGPLEALLGAEDAKVRRFAAQLLGLTESEDVLPALMQAYRRETTQFVRADYLKAMEELDVRAYLPELRRRRDELTRELVQPAVQPATEPLSEHASKWDSRPHLEAELQQLTRMLAKYEAHRRPAYTAWEPAPDVVLITNREQAAVTERQITEGETRLLKSGVRVHNGNLREILQVRTWSELLLPLPGAGAVSGSAEEAAEALARMRIVPFLDSLHNTQPDFRHDSLQDTLHETAGAKAPVRPVSGTNAGTMTSRHETAGAAGAAAPAWRYRIELRSAKERKGDFIRRLAQRLDALSGGRLLNTAEHYDVELRLLERKDGGLVPMLKLFTIPDRRFAYRRAATAQSMSPYNAALVCALAAPWLKDGAQVLDPFCGGGTLLIERGKVKAADPRYGIDLLGEAVEKARVNADADGSVIHFINRDFFDFRHEYPFDEICTQLPDAGGAAQPAYFYEHFLEKAASVLRGEGAEGLIVAVTDAPALLLRAAAEQGVFRKEAAFLLSERTRTTVLVLAGRKYTV